MARVEATKSMVDQVRLAGDLFPGCGLHNPGPVQCKSRLDQVLCLEDPERVLPPKLPATSTREKKLLKKADITTSFFKKKIEKLQKN